eukprot:1309757-Amphidinium_carterae.1
MSALSLRLANSANFITWGAHSLNGVQGVHDKRAPSGVDTTPSHFPGTPPVFTYMLPAADMRFVNDVLRPDRLCYAFYVTDEPQLN